MINNPASLLEKQDQSRKHVIKGNIIKFDQINNEIFSICIPEKGFNIYSNSDNIPQLILKKGIFPLFYLKNNFSSSSLSFPFIFILSLISLIPFLFLLLLLLKLFFFRIS